MTPSRRKPDWLKVRLPGGAGYARIDRYHRQDGLHTVCRSASCPNQGECWTRGTATFMILGDRCTRTCSFCNVDADTPLPVMSDEPEKVAAAVSELGLRHAVITSVTRDDLSDGGAAHFARVTRAIRKRSPGCRIELLIPDLGGDHNALKTILDAEPDVLGHNIETVPRLYPRIRPEASYRRSLYLLEVAHAYAAGIKCKSGIMVGLGETRDEITNVMNDLKRTGTSLLTIGQYLSPTRKHAPVERYLEPAEFDDLKREGMALGFCHVESGPLVRSSYHAEEQMNLSDNRLRAEEG